MVLFQYSFTYLVPGTAAFNTQIQLQKDIVTCLLPFLNLIKKKFQIIHSKLNKNPHSLNKKKKESIFFSGNCY